MPDTPEPSASFASITSGVVSFLGAPHVPVDELADHDARAAFLGFPFDGANAAIERPGSANGPRGLRIASNMCFPWSFEWDIDLFEAYDLVDCGDAPLAIGNAVRTHELVQETLEAILSAGVDPDRDRRRPLLVHPGRPGAELAPRPGEANGISADRRAPRRRGRDRR